MVLTRIRRKASSALKRRINESRRSALKRSKLLAEFNATARSIQYSDMKRLLADSSARVSAQKAEHVKKMRKMQVLRGVVAPRLRRKKPA